jgi:hypothetical protein
VAGSCEHGNEPSGSIKGESWIGLATLSFSTKTFLAVLHEIDKRQKASNINVYGYPFDIIGISNLSSSVSISFHRARYC